MLSTTIPKAPPAVLFEFDPPIEAMGPILGRGYEDELILGEPDDEALREAFNEQFEPFVRELVDNVMRHAFMQAIGRYAHLGRVVGKGNSGVCCYSHIEAAKQDVLTVIELIGKVEHPDRWDAESIINDIFGGDLPEADLSDTPWGVLQ